jgi:hypothetical protein
MRNMLLRSLKRLESPEEEEGVVLKRMVGAVEVEGTSLEMVGSVVAWGFMSVMNTSFTKVRPDTFSIIIMI